MRFQHDLKRWQMSKMSSKWAHWTQSKLCLVTQLFPFPEEKEQRPAVDKKKNGTYFLPCGQWLNCKGTGEANIRGRPPDFWGRGGGMGDFSKKISCRLISGEKSLVRRYLRKKNILHWKKLPLMAHKLCWKKNLTPLYVREKIFQRFGRKNSYPNHITYTPLRSQIVNPWVRFVSLTFFQQFLELVGPNNSTSI